ncbi:MAG TPA: NADH-quinone oxidoreductase subunit M [Gemmataceae bacterium]|jgi:NADH-quinone oxidoreductase subunit M|nr:NADH-quinone oxidoreductase subunit M [Gemmataceae bacterium]
MKELLLLLLIVPLAAAVVVALLGPRRTTAIRWISLAATLVSAAIAFTVAVNLAQKETDQATGQAVKSPTPQTFTPSYVTRISVLPLGPGAVQFYIGLDGLNVWLVTLTAVLMVSSVLASWHTPQVKERINEYFAWLLLLEVGMIGLFLSFDIILFYVFFELTLVPLFFLIGIWGGPERRHAARKFFIYTLTGSLITLLGLIGAVILVYQHRPDELTFSIPELVQALNERFSLPVDRAYWLNVQFWLFLALIAGFSIKVPLVPLHTWLPLAHVEAPTAGSVLLAGVLLKIGTYGYLRLCLPLAPDASLRVGVPLIGTLAVIGIIYGALTALAQNDMKKLVAYSSVSHLGFCMLGMFALNLTGLSGSLMQMINHGLSTGALFLLVGMLYDRYHTRQLQDYGGMGAKLKLLACFMVFICLTSLGLPGLNGFVGESLVFFGMFQLWPALAVIGTAGIVLGAWYLLRLLLRIFFGPVKEPHHEGAEPVTDLNLRDLAALVPIAALCLLIGVYPQPILKTSERDLGVVVRILNDAADRARALEIAAVPAAEKADQKSASTLDKGDRPR